MTKTEKRKLENYEQVIAKLENRMKYCSEIHDSYKGIDPKINIKRNIISYAKLVAYSYVLYQLTKGIK